MILDDHDLRDDWNTSQEWRDRVTRTPWWRERVVGAFASYWVYQHLGNLSPTELEQDALYRRVREDGRRRRPAPGCSTTSPGSADAEPDSARWSFFRDFGTEDHGIRLVVVDSRCSRVLDPRDGARWSTTPSGTGSASRCSPPTARGSTT